MWTTLDTLTLSSNWQYCPESEHGLYRLTALTEALSPSGSAIVGRYDIGQFDTDGTGHGIRAFRRESFGVIFLLQKPAFFESQRIGLRVPTGFYPFNVQIEVNDMPLSSVGSSQSAGASVTSGKASSATEIVLVAPDPDRKMLQITNQANKSLFIDFDGAVSLTSFAVEIKSNTMYEMPIGFTGEVKGIWAATPVGQCKIVEFF
jgi:hypothetical protein